MEERQRWQRNGRNETQIRDGLVKEFGGTKAIRIEQKQALSDHEVLLSLLIEHENGQSERAKMKVHLINQEWKLAGPPDTGKTAE